MRQVREVEEFKRRSGNTPDSFRKEGIDLIRAAYDSERRLNAGQAIICTRRKWNLVLKEFTGNVDRKLERRRMSDSDSDSIRTILISWLNQIAEYDAGSVQREDCG